ncbi:phosphatase PAP2 family protein [Chlamydiota bacterium]
MKIVKWLVLLILLFLPQHVKARCGFESAGDALQIILPATAFGFTLIKGDWQGSTQAAVTFGVTVFTVTELKYLCNCTRPNGGCHSFPSGHTAISFASAGFMQRRYGWRYGLPYYGAAVVVGCSRVHAKAHWVRDVFGGAAIGWLSSRIFSSPYCRGKLHICPEVTLHSASLSATYCF